MRILPIWLRNYGLGGRLHIRTLFAGDVGGGRPSSSPVENGWLPRNQLKGTYVKKIALTVAAVAVLGLAACSGDNEANTATDANLEATANEANTDLENATFDAENAATDALDSAANLTDQAGEAIENAAEATEQAAENAAE